MTNAIQQQLSQVFDLLATVPVAGNHVETMAQVRAALREVYGALGSLENILSEAPLNPVNPATPATPATPAAPPEYPAGPAESPDIPA